MNNKTWVQVWGFWLLGGWTTKTKAWSNNWIKNAKTLFNKFLTFLIQMLDHTLVFVVQPPNSQKPHTSTHVLLLANLAKRKSFARQFFDILFVISHFWNLWKIIQSKLDGKSSKFEKTTKHEQKQQIFIVTLTEKFSVADYWYMLYKFTQYTWALSSSLFCHI